MITPDTVRRIALEFEGSDERPHVDRRAFRTKRAIFASLREADGTTNVKLPRDHQEMVCAAAPEIFKPVAGGWGRMGWTTINLAKASESDLRSALTVAWKDAQPRPKRR